MTLSSVKKNSLREIANVSCDFASNWLKIFPVFAPSCLDRLMIEAGITATMIKKGIKNIIFFFSGIDDPLKIINSIRSMMKGSVAVFSLVLKANKAAISEQI